MLKIYLVVIKNPRYIQKLCGLAEWQRITRLRVRKMKVNLCNCAIILSFLKKVKDQHKWSIFQCFYFPNKIWEPVLLSEIKMYLCLRYENLRIGNKINKFTPDHINFPPNRERLPVPLQMQLSKKLKIFCVFIP